MYTGEKNFCSYNFWTLSRSFFVAYFALYESSLDFERREDQIDIAYKRQIYFSICR